jgi:ASC-1-like (ASCH) protein
MSKAHLVILKECYLSRILDGSKPVELRLLRTPCAPYGAIAVGDRLFFKQTGGPVCAVGRVSSFQEYKNLTPSEIMKLKTIYNHLVFGTDEYWQMKADSRYAVFIWIRDVKKIRPVMIDKKDMRAWAVLTAKQNFGLLGSTDIVD